MEKLFATAILVSAIVLFSFSNADKYEMVTDEGSAVSKEMQVKP
ncbi:MAG: hypothetical protein R2769_02805 [Saprospiraceae bacterium]